MQNFSDNVSFLWSVADLLRGPYKPNQYGRVILPLTVLRRLDSVLEPTKDAVLARAEKLILKVSTAIDRLREYRTALISAAVTGKIDVRNHPSVTETES